MRNYILGFLPDRIDRMACKYFRSCLNTLERSKQRNENPFDEKITDFNALVQGTKEYLGLFRIPQMKYIHQNVGLFDTKAKHEF